MQAGYRLAIPPECTLLRGNCRITERVSPINEEADFPSYTYGSVGLQPAWFVIGYQGRNLFDYVEKS